MDKITYINQTIGEKLDESQDAFEQLSWITEVSDIYAQKIYNQTPKRTYLESQRQRAHHQALEQAWHGFWKD